MNGDCSYWGWEISGVGKTRSKALGRKAGDLWGWRGRVRGGVVGEQLYGPIRCWHFVWIRWESWGEVHSTSRVALAITEEETHGQEQREAAQCGGCWRHPRERRCWPGSGSSGGDAIVLDSGSSLKAKLKGFAGELDVSCAEWKESSCFFPRKTELPDVGRGQEWGKGRSGVKLWLCQLELPVRCQGGDGEQAVA